METNQLEHYSVLECMGVNEKDSLRVNHETRTIELLVNTTCDKRTLYILYTLYFTTVSFLPLLFPSPCKTFFLFTFDINLFKTVFYDEEHC